MLLKIEQRTSNDVATDNSAITILHEMGRCLMEMNKLCDAKDSLQKVLEIEQ